MLHTLLKLGFNTPTSRRAFEIPHTFCTFFLSLYLRTLPNLKLKLCGISNPCSISASLQSHEIKKIIMRDFKVPRENEICSIMSRFTKAFEIPEIKLLYFLL